MSEPESNADRDEFFKWLSTCPFKWFVTEDDQFESVVIFEYYGKQEEKS
jgi:hypothetical protein